MTIVDLAAAREQRNAPHSDHVYIDANGAQWFEYDIAYRDPQTGTRFRFTIWATDAIDAQRRIECVKTSAEVAGQIYATYPA